MTFIYLLLLNSVGRHWLIKSWRFRVAPLPRRPACHRPSAFSSPVALLSASLASPSPSSPSPLSLLPFPQHPLLLISCTMLSLRFYLLVIRCTTYCLYQPPAPPPKNGSSRQRFPPVLPFPGWSRKHPEQPLTQSRCSVPNECIYCTEVCVLSSSLLIN